MPGQSLRFILAGAQLREPAPEQVTVPEEVHLEAIAEEVQASWRLKEIQVEKLMQKAVARSERPWLILLTTLSAVSAGLLALVIWRLHGLS